MFVAVLGEEYQLTDEKRAQVREMLKQQCTKNGAADKVDEVEVNTIFLFSLLHSTDELGIIKITHR